MKGRPIDVKASNRLLALLLLVACVSVSFLIFQSSRTINGEAATPSLPSMNLTVIGNGTSIVLNETDIGGMQVYSGYGGFKNVLGNLKGLGNYTGVPVTAICSLVSTLTSSSTVRFVAVDNYTETLTYSQIYGNLTTYENVTGETVQRNQSLTPILAYFFDGQPLASGDGPLRLAFVGPEGLATDSVYWVKEVVHIDVLDQSVPEFPQQTVLPLLFTVTLAAALCARTYLRRDASKNLNESLFKVTSI